MKNGTFVPNGGHNILQQDTAENIIKEGEGKMYRPDRVLRNFLHPVLTSGNISEGFVNMIEDGYEALLKELPPHKSEVRIPISEIIENTSLLSLDSQLTPSEQGELKQTLETTLRDTLITIGAIKTLTTRKSPHYKPIDELRVDKSLIRRLQIAAGKQKISEVLSGEVKYTASPKYIIESVKDRLNRLGVTHGYMDDFIQENTPSYNNS